MTGRRKVVTKHAPALDAEVAVQTSVLPLQPGDWTPTGLGAGYQHRVRTSDERFTVWAHAADLPGSTCPDRVETSRINRDAPDTERCPRCAVLPDLGPLAFPPCGDVRRSPDGLLAFAKWPRTSDLPYQDRLGGIGGWVPVGAPVAGWEPVGNVHDLTEPTAPSALSGGRPPLGEVRRRGDGALAVCDSDRWPSPYMRHVRWSWIGPDWEGHHGWRCDRDVEGWPRVGNVFELGAAHDTPTVLDEPGPVGQVGLFPIPEVV